ncbi:fibronectin type III-like domain-containing protein [Lactarius hatsudake]|nr:fibronectin type III-like domain-containing protein [Lactarius hatsudake]
MRGKPGAQRARESAKARRRAALKKHPESARKSGQAWASAGEAQGERWRITDDEIMNITYSEGFIPVTVDYRHFDVANVAPRPDVGGQDQVGAVEANWATGKASPQVVGSSTALWLHRPAFSGHFPARVGESPSVLREFADADLQPGQVQSITITLSRYDLSIWDVVSQSWICPSGTYSLSVGASSWDFRLKGKIPL